MTLDKGQIESAEKRYCQENKSGQSNPLGYGVGTFPRWSKRFPFTGSDRSRHPNLQSKAGGQSTDISSPAKSLPRCYRGDVRESGSSSNEAPASFMIEVELNFLKCNNLFEG